MIDAVITWVDGADPRIAAKRRHFTDGTPLEALDDIAGATRFADCGELRWCVRSIELYAPWVRKIFIVTDGQRPDLPEGKIPVEIVDHQVIFRGYEEFLPTFNSLSIETMLWRIPGLSDQFLYFNDDFILIGPTSPDDFFDPDGHPIVYGYPRSVLHGRLGRVIELVRRPANPKVKFRDSMMKAALLLGRNRFYRIQHVPHAIRRDVLARYFADHEEQLRQNISHRFRHYDQFNPQELQYLLCARRMKSHRPLLVYVEPRHPKIIDRPTAKFFCVNSLDAFPADARARVESFLEQKLR